MTDRGILFSAPMVRAILAGVKTQTRREVDWSRCFGMSDGSKRRVFTPNDVPAMNDMLRERQTSPHKRFCPYGQVGSRLWVRETWAAPHNTDCLKPSEIDRDWRIHYAATEDLGGLRKRPSIFMPRWASRITLDITSVRVERLQDISEVDAMAEGCIMRPYRHCYQALWESINGAGSWDEDPLVWVIEFQRARKPDEQNQSAPSDPSETR